MVNNTSQKSRLIIVLLIVAILLLGYIAIKLTAGCIVHKYSAATCTEPSVCARCGKVGQGALGHSYEKNTSLGYAICTRCGDVLELRTDSYQLPTQQAAAPAETQSVRTEAPAQKTDIAAEARAQGIQVADHLSSANGCERYCTFYTTDNDDGINMKSAPENGNATKIGSVILPFNGYLCGTDGAWYLVRDMKGSYFYIYAPIVGVIDIDSSVGPNDYSAILDLARTQGIIIPDGFTVSGAVSGEIANYSTETYAIYKFKDPNKNTKNDKYGLFYFYNSTNPDTYNYDGTVTIYGYYNNLGLCEHDGEFFWAGTSLFRKG